MKKIKRFLAALLITVLSLSTIALAEENTSVSDADVISHAQDLVTSNFLGISSDICEYYVDNETGMVQRAYTSFLPYTEEGKLGDFSKFGDTKVSRSDDGIITCELIVICSKEQLKTTINFKIVNDELLATEIAFESYDSNSASFASKMGTAALNTLLGLSTVFIVLLLISAIISLFKFIPKIQNKLANKGKEKTTEAAVDNAIAQITQNEELCDDLELVAVITAAVAMASGTSSDGFVVRSIKKAKRNR